MHVITRRELRGAEVVAAQLCERFVQRGHAVLLVGLFQPPDLTAAEQLTRRVPQVRDLGGPKRRGLDLQVLCRLRAVTAEFRPDVVQANAFNALKFAALVKYFGRHRWPLVYRNVGLASQWVTRPGQRLWGKFLLRRVEQVVSVSEASRVDFAETFGLSRDRIRIARQGVAITPREDTEPARAQLAALANCPAEATLLVHVGNFAPEKNHAGLLDAFAAIRGRWPAAHLILIGDGPLRQDIDRRVRELGLRDAVHLPGSRADAATLVAGADLLLLASHVEGIPGVVLEAFASGVPVVATRVGGLPEVVQPGVTGSLVPPGDMAALAADTCRLLGNTELRKRMGEAAREFVRRNYSMESSVDELEALYGELVARQKAVEKSKGGRVEEVKSRKVERSRSQKAEESKSRKDGEQECRGEFFG